MSPSFGSLYSIYNSCKVVCTFSACVHVCVCGGFSLTESKWDVYVTSGVLNVSDCSANCMDNRTNSYNYIITIVAHTSG